MLKNGSGTVLPSIFCFLAEDKLYQDYCLFLFFSNKAYLIVT